MPPIAILVALADPTRCRIIEILQTGPQPVHQIADAFDISRPAISRHLGVLKQARLISEKKSGRENRYELHTKRLKPVRDWLVGLASVPLPKAKPPAKSAALTPKKQPEPKPAPIPVLEQPVVAATRQKPAASQMGFDF
ncbi:ArsR/SmtB family transcription factor [Devosia sp. SL43]|uniref:ArsR/SmtB family transcription factor n=1 Tax=Devosia sp. SL43 TaxID=2806348 RepID=UPI001EFF5FD2|nr:metalloregulator ArsR/SmtB family transcription factor [Devosia sp. SL43]UJW85920.1 winged helix-turn-helix transcriptional regulator [Devosia sp. SL43]